MADLTLNTVWNLFNSMIRSNSGTKVSTKMQAVNEGYKNFQRLMLADGRPLQELISNPTDVATVINQNYVALPSDYFAFKKAFYKTGSDYIPFYENQILDYDTLLEEVGQRFFDTTDIGDPTSLAVNEPRIYLDRHSSSSESDGIKLIYHHIPTTLIAYDELPIDNISGVFEVGEIITGGTTSSTAIVYQVNATSLYVYSEDRDGSFSDNEEITGSASAATADVNGTLSEKPQVLEISDKYSTEVATAIAGFYLFMRDEDEAMAKNATLEALVQKSKSVNKEKISYKFQLSSRGNKKW